MTKNIEQILKDHLEYLKTGDISKKMDLRGEHLRGADLRGADLRGADLRGADLRHADLSFADLSFADLRDADLRGADLRHANLSKVNLHMANLRDADLRDANLSHANLSMANLRDADLQYADLYNTTMTNDNKLYKPIQIINTRYFITILHDKVLWGCKTFTHEEVKNLTEKDCGLVCDLKELESNKKIILECINFYFGGDTHE